MTIYLLSLHIDDITVPRRLRGGPAATVASVIANTYEGNAKQQDRVEVPVTPGQMYVPTFLR